MFKKTLLSAALITSAFATAQIQLDLDITITKEFAERHIVSTVLVDENSPASFEFDNNTIINLSVNTNQNGVLIDADILEKTTSDELISISKPTILASWNKIASIKVGDSDGNSLIFLVTASQVQ
jgi:hypothetical protein